LLIGDWRQGPAPNIVIFFPYVNRNFITRISIIWSGSDMFPIILVPLVLYNVRLSVQTTPFN
jgi:hypothetical protein